jgi:hypothetical protein
MGITVSVPSVLRPYRDGGIRAKFSKAHYEAITEALKRARQVALATSDENSHPIVQHTLAKIRAALIDVFIEDNRRFDPVEFRLNTAVNEIRQPSKRSGNGSEITKTKYRD